MTVGEIIKAVRWCIDEEDWNDSDLASASDTALMDRIIKSKIGDAVRWVCLYGPSELLEGSDESTATGILVDATLTTGQTQNGITYTVETTCGRLVMPANYIRLSRVRCTGWHRAVRDPLAEDSEEYLQLNDSNGATATLDRPQAAQIEKKVREVELWPSGTTADVTIVVDPDTEVSQTADDSVTVALPPKSKTAFIYYLAFLLLSAYGDPKAARMLDIAKMNIGRNG